MAAALALALVGAAPTANAAAPASEASATPTTTATLHVRDLDEGALRRDLSLRSPRLELREVAAEADAPPDAVIVVRPAGDGFALTIVLQDGRAFDRQVAAAGPQAPRIVASTLANLLAAIAEARVAADRDAVDPSREIAALDGDEPAPESEPEPEPEPEPELEPEPEPEPEPKDEPEPRDDATPWRLGVDLAPQALLQLPRDRGLKAFGGGGLNLGATVQSPRGARLGVDLRGLWWREEALALHRYRVALRGGYAFERGRFGLAVDAFIAVEPWQLRADGQPLTVAAGESEEATTTALAGGLRLLPAYLVPLGDRPVRLRVAAWTELAYAGVPAEGGLRAVYLRAEDADDPSLRVGGVELSLGALIGLDFDLRRRRR